MAAAEAAGLNINCYPTNLVVREGLLYYVDYECNSYMDEWSFENRGLSCWRKVAGGEDRLAEEKNQELGDDSHTK